MTEARNKSKWIDGYRAGIAAAKHAAESSQISVTWGPKAVPDDGVEAGRLGALHAIDVLASAAADDGFFEARTMSATQQDQTQ